jgi:uncharacterized protein YndB with AHSA1/START domain
VTGFEIRQQRLVDAPPDIAFQEWVGADARMRWHKPEPHWVVEANTDLRVYGAWRVAFGPSRAQMFVEEGVFDVVEPPHRVAYTCRHHQDGRPTFETLVTVTFEAWGERTLVTLVEVGFPDDALRREYERGWPAFLDAFDHWVAVS